jgi:hypothetical protein
VLSQGGKYWIRERHGAEARLRLRRYELEVLARVRRELAIDAKRAAEEVDPVKREPEHLTAAKPGSSGGDDHGPVPFRRRGHDGVHLLSGHRYEVRGGGL